MVKLTHCSHFCVAFKRSSLSLNRFDFHFYPRPGTAEGLLMMVRLSLSVERVVQQQLGGSWSRIGLHTLVSFKGVDLQVGRGWHCVRRCWKLLLLANGIGVSFCCKELIRVEPEQ